MTYTYQLVLYYQDGSKEIINTTYVIKEIDDVTSQFSTLSEMCSYYHCQNIKLIFKGGERQGSLPLLFKADKFKKESVLYTYKKYLSDNEEKRQDFLKKVSRTVSRGMPPKSSFDEKCLTVYNKFGKNKELYDPLLKEILISYFGRDKAIYSKYRQAYFELKEQGIKVECYHPVKKETKKEEKNEIIEGYYTTDDTVADSLKKYNGEVELFNIIIYLLKEEKFIPNTVKILKEGEEIPKEAKYFIRKKDR